MGPISPTGYAHLAVLEHILRVPTKIHVHDGRIVPSASTSLPTAQAAPTAPAAAAQPEHIPPLPTHSLAPLGQLALQVRR
jgi:hypothetical protein